MDLILHDVCSHRCGEENEPVPIAQKATFEVLVPDITGQTTLEAKLNQTMFEHNPNRTCRNCNKKGWDTLTRIQHLPEIIFIKLNYRQTLRGQYQRCVIPETLDLTAWRQNPSNGRDDPSIYRLMAVVSFSGSRAAGHYKTFVRTAGNVWRELDDTSTPQPDDDPTAWTLDGINQLNKGGQGPTTRFRPMIMAYVKIRDITPGGSVKSPAAEPPRPQSPQKKPEEHSDMSNRTLVDLSQLSDEWLRVECQNLGVSVRAGASRSELETTYRQAIAVPLTWDIRSKQWLELAVTTAGMATDKKKPTRDSLIDQVTKQENQAFISIKIKINALGATASEVPNTFIIPVQNYDAKVPLQATVDVSAILQSGAWLLTDDVSGPTTKSIVFATPTPGAGNKRKPEDGGEVSPKKKPKPSTKAALSECSHIQKKHRKCLDKSCKHNCKYCRWFQSQ